MSSTEGTAVKTAEETSPSIDGKIIEDTTPIAQPSDAGKSVNVAESKIKNETAIDTKTSPPIVENTELVTTVENPSKPSEINGQSIPQTTTETTQIIEANNTTGNEVVKETGTIEVKEEKSESSVENKSNEKPLKDPENGSIGAGDSCVLQKSKEQAEKMENLETTKNNEPVKSNAQVEKPAMNGAKTGNEEILIEKLKQALKKTMEERDSFRNKLDNTEKRLAILQETYDAITKGDEDSLRKTVDQLRGKLIQTSLQLEDRNRLAAHQEKQINALNSQVASLKEVETLTRSLLEIRNMEVKHLQAEVDDMEVRISEERDRYSTMIKKMDAAVQLNSDLKKEYETQLGLFKDLREKYEEKVTLLSKEKEALENAAQTK